MLYPKIIDEYILATISETWRDKITAFALIISHFTDIGLVLFVHIVCRHKRNGLIWRIALYC